MQSGQYPLNSVNKIVKFLFLLSSSFVHYVWMNRFWCRCKHQMELHNSLQRWHAQDVQIYLIYHQFWSVIIVIVSECVRGTNLPTINSTKNRICLHNFHHFFRKFFNQQIILKFPWKPSAVDNSDPINKSCLIYQIIRMKIVAKNVKIQIMANE